MIRYRRPYRLLRVGVGLARVLPRYGLLLARDRAARRVPALATSRADWERAHRAAAREMRRVALALAGAFTKAAQIGGARADILPAPFIEELSQFHDAVPPRPFASLRPALERDLGRPPDAVFARVEPTALAAASLAQVHRATLRDDDPAAHDPAGPHPSNREVVVKIQYPEVRRIIPLDLAMLRRIAALVQRLQRRVDLRSLVSEVTRFIELELDFQREVRSARRLAETLADDPDVRVPRVHEGPCGPNVIVLEYLEGIQITRTAELVAAGHHLPDLAKKVGALYGAMLFEHDFFHGDPHPGNLLVLPDGRIGLLDFGLCKELPRGFAGGLARMMVSAMIGDGEASLAAAEELGFDTAQISPHHLRSLMLMTIGDSDSDEGLLDILGQSRVRRIPEHFALVIRTLVLLNGLSHRLAPGRRLIQAELLQHLAAGAMRDTERGSETRAVFAHPAAS